MIKAVIFDIDGVLIDSFDANLKFFQELMITAGFKPPTKEEFLSVHHLSLMHLIKHFNKDLPEKEVRQIWNLVQDGKVKYYHELYKSPKNIVKIMQNLHNNYLLGIVTNRIKKGAERALESTKIRKNFSVVTAYENTTKHKPDPEPLLLTAKLLKVKPEECVYVGDVENDIKAGKSAGMKTIIYSKEKFPNANICIDDFNKLPEAIKSLK